MVLKSGFGNVYYFPLQLIRIQAQKQRQTSLPGEVIFLPLSAYNAKAQTPYYSGKPQGSD